MSEVESGTIVRKQIEAISKEIKGFGGQKLTEEDITSICKSITDLGELSIKAENQTSAKLEQLIASLGNLESNCQELRAKLKAAQSDKKSFLSELFDAQIEILELEKKISELANS